MHKVCVCLECNAEFIIRHDMGDDHYQVTFCPFCGAELDVEEEYDINEEDDE